MRSEISRQNMKNYIYIYIYIYTNIYTYIHMYFPKEMLKVFQTGLRKKNSKVKVCQIIK